MATVLYIAHEVAFFSVNQVMSGQVLHVSGLVLTSGPFAPVFVALVVHHRHVLLQIGLFAEHFVASLFRTREPVIVGQMYVLDVSVQAFVELGLEVTARVCAGERLVDVVLGFGVKNQIVVRGKALVTDIAYIVGLLLCQVFLLRVTDEALPLTRPEVTIGEIADILV